MARFKVVIIDCDDELATLLLKRGLACFIIFDKEQRKFILFQADGLHHRRELCDEEEAP